MSERVVSRSAHFGRVPESLLLDPTLSSEACRLYALLTTFDYRRTGKAWCGREEAAVKLGWSVSTVGRRLKELQEAGAIVRRRGRREVMVIELLADVVQEGSAVTSLGGSKTGQIEPQDGSPADLSYPPAPISLQEKEREGTASPDGDAPSALFPTQEQGQAQGQLQGQGQGPVAEAARIQRLVAGYVEDYQAERSGHGPPRNWRGAAGRAVKAALSDGEAEDDVALCLGTIAHEGKNPNTLAYVLGDYHANRPRRKIQ